MKVHRFILFFAVVALLSSCNFFKKKDKLISNDVDTLLSQPLDTVQEDTTDFIQFVEEEEPAFLEPGIGYTSDNYYMIVGSFLSENLAMKYANTMLDMGYQPQVIYFSDLGYYRVSAQSYEDMTSAINDIPNFRSNVTNRAWVHVKR